MKSAVTSLIFSVENSGPIPQLRGRVAGLPEFRAPSVSARDRTNIWHYMCAHVYVRAIETYGSTEVRV